MKIKNEVTSAMVAKMANVSQATVSRVFSKNGYVSDETRENVLKVAADMGYLPNAFARGLSAQKSDLIAVISLGSRAPIYQSFLDKIFDMNLSLGKNTILFYNKNPKEIAYVIKKAMEYRVDGLIIIPPLGLPDDVNFSELTENGTPVAVYNYNAKNRGCFSVSPDEYHIGVLAAKHLFNKGYKSAAFFGSNVLGILNDLRGGGFKDTAQRLGIKLYPDIMSKDLSYDSVIQGFEQYEFKDQLPEAIFCIADHVAVPAMDYVRYTLKETIPSDVAFIGVDNFVVCDYGSYKLTSISQPFSEMVVYLRDYFERYFNGENTSDCAVTLSCKIIEREST